MYPRQMCNAALAQLLEDRPDPAQRQELIAEIYASLDPWEQADAIWGQYYPGQQ